MVVLRLPLRTLGECISFRHAEGRHITETVSKTFSNSFLEMFLVVQMYILQTSGLLFKIYGLNII